MQDERKQVRKENEKPLELPGCYAYPTGSTCPIDWCRKARGEWCQWRDI